VILGVIDVVAAGKSRRPDVIRPPNNMRVVESDQSLSNYILSSCWIRTCDEW